MDFALPDGHVVTLHIAASPTGHGADVFGVVLPRDQRAGRSTPFRLTLSPREVREILAQLQECAHASHNA